MSSPNSVTYLTLPVQYTMFLYMLQILVFVTLSSSLGFSVIVLATIKNWALNYDTDICLACLRTLEAKNETMP